MYGKMALVLFVILFAVTLSPVYAASPCSSRVYLTLSGTAPLNASVGIDNITYSAYLSKFIYNNQSMQCLLVGVPNGNVSFYITSNLYSSPLYNRLLDIGNESTNSTGYAEVSYNSSLIGPNILNGIARWYGNSTQGSVQSNNATEVLVRPVAEVQTTCSGNCGNTTIGKQFTLTSVLCVGRPPFSWQTCEYLPNAKLSFYASDTFIGTSLTNATGTGALTVNTILLIPGTYDVYSIWRGGTQYANSNASSRTANLDLNLYAAEKSTTTTVTTSTESNQSTSPAINIPPQSLSYLYAGIIILAIILAIAAYFLGHHHGRRAAKREK